LLCEIFALKNFKKCQKKKKTATFCIKIRPKTPSFDGKKREKEVVLSRKFTKKHRFLINYQNQKSDDKRSVGPNERGGGLVS